ncbi:hypothetical protein ACHAO7_011881 [Fusarium culmorum]
MHHHDSLAHPNLANGNELVVNDKDIQDIDGKQINDNSIFQLKDQGILMKDPKLIKGFSEALKKLTSCRSITFTDDEVPLGIFGPNERVHPSQCRPLVLKSGASIAFVSKLLFVVLVRSVPPRLDAVAFDFGEVGSDNGGSYS